MIEFLLNVLYKELQDFFDTFSLVSGRASLRVVLFSGMYLILSFIGLVFEIHTFANWISSLIAFCFILLMVGISTFTRRDIQQVKQWMKGGSNQ